MFAGKIRPISEGCGNRHTETGGQPNAVNAMSIWQADQHGRLITAPDPWSATRKRVVIFVTLGCSEHGCSGPTGESKPAVAKEE